MRNPYIVGRWVRGSDHYDRQGLTEYLLTTQDTAIWLMGARRMGKTSLLRHLEHMTDQETGHFVPLYWDLQGCTSKEHLGAELFAALEDAERRFAAYDVDLAPLEGLDAVAILRSLNRSLAQADRRLLLLVDEAEVLIAIAQFESAWLARLRKVLQEGRQRTIIASTKLLATMTAHSSEWVTSPFLFGFHLVNLHALERAGSEALIRQAQAELPIQAHPAVISQILLYTNGHPYLIQWLCQRLFVPLDETQGYLRDVQDEDLIVDPLMASLFEVDVARLSRLERQVLYSIAQAGRCSPDALVAWHPGVNLTALTAVLRSLEEFGHARRYDGLLEVGNEFLYRWLLANLDRLLVEAADAGPIDVEDAPVDDEIAQLARLLGIAPERIRDLINIRISTPEEFFQAIQGFFIQIRHLVEQDDGHRLLLTSAESGPDSGIASGPDSGTASGAPRLRSEDEVQIALKHWLRPMCRALNIQMDRETRTGRGLLDFKFSLGHDFRCLVEVKLFNNTRLQDGLSIQLPIYLLADHAAHGLYVPIFLESPAYPLALARLRETAQRQAEQHGVRIEIVDIRAWKPQTASRADSVGEFERYRLPHAAGEEELP